MAASVYALYSVIYRTFEFDVTSLNFLEKQV